VKTAPPQISKQGVRMVQVTWLDSRSSTRRLAVMFPCTCPRSCKIPTSISADTRPVSTMMRTSPRTISAFKCPSRRAPPAKLCPPVELNAFPRESVNISEICGWRAATILSTPFVFHGLEMLTLALVAPAQDDPWVLDFRESAWQLLPQTKPDSGHHTPSSLSVPRMPHAWRRTSTCPGPPAPGPPAAGCGKGVALTRESCILWPLGSE
jgi:hypothetical protein